MNLSDWNNSTLKNYQKKYNPPFYEVDHILDYLKATPTLRLNRLSYPQAKVKADSWTRALNKKNKGQKDHGKVKTIMTFPNGMKIVRLLDQKAKNWEGAHMNHCVASYKYHRGIYSLRDVNNMPHCTMEINWFKKVDQIKGKGNCAIPEKYHHYILTFLQSKNYRFSNCRDSFMSKLGYYEFTSKAHRDFICKNFTGLKFAKFDILYYQDAEAPIQLSAQPLGIVDSILYSDYDFKLAVECFVDFAIKHATPEICDFLASDRVFPEIKDILALSFSKLCGKPTTYPLVSKILPQIKMDTKRREIIRAVDKLNLELLKILISPDGKELSQESYDLSSKKIAQMIITSRSKEIAKFIINFKIKDINEAIKREIIYNNIQYSFTPPPREIVEFKIFLLSLLEDNSLTENEVYTLLFDNLSFFQQIIHLDRFEFHKSKGVIENLSCKQLPTSLLTFLKETNPFFNSVKNTLLEHALSRGEMSSISFLLENGAIVEDINSREFLRFLMSKAQSGETSFVKDWINKGINLHRFEYAFLSFVTQIRNHELRVFVLEKLSQTKLPELNPSFE